MIYADQRWIGNHGIGRFARHVLDGLDFCKVPLSSFPAAPFDFLRLSLALRCAGANDLFFSPGYNSPLCCRAPFIFTLHDLSHIQCAENRKPQISVYYATLMKRACRRAVAILTVSEFTKKQVVDWSHVRPEKIVNVGCGVDAAYQPAGDAYGLSFPYLLSVSNRRPHKNEARVVEAFANANLDPRLQLVFTGEETAALANAIEKQAVSSRVVFVGTIPEDRLPALYRGAQALIFPSLYEGFGLPVLEAMACGTPVVTSNVTAIPEIAGDAALLVDPRSVEQISRAMETIVKDGALRQRLVDKGVKRAAQFSWTKTANKVQKVIAMHAGLN